MKTQIAQKVKWNVTANRELSKELHVDTETGNIHYTEDLQDICRFRCVGKDGKIVWDQDVKERYNCDVMVQDLKGEDLFDDDFVLCVLVR